MFVEQGAQSKDQVGPEGRKDEEILSRQPREERVTDQPMAEMSREQSEGPPESLEAQTGAQAHPPRAEGPVRVDHALGAAGGSGREQDKRIGVERERARLPREGRSEAIVAAVGGCLEDPCAEIGEASRE